MDVNQRIAQFETMVRPGADPDNDMAWFSLGRAYAEAGRHAEAATAFERCFTLNPGMSKAYQLAGEALIASGELSKAADVLTRGYESAGKRGDRMPMTAMGDLLRKIGHEPPAPPTTSATATESGQIAGGFVCRRSGKPGTKMDRPPFKGVVGVWIQQHIARETWEDWVKQGTKVINEMRLDLSREEDSETYDRHMREYLGLDEETHAGLRGGGS